MYGVKWQNFKLVLVQQKYLTDPALPLGQRSVISQIVARQFFFGADDFLTALLEQVIPDESPGLPLRLTPRAPLVLRHDIEEHIAFAPLPQRATNPSRRPSQAPHFSRSWLGEKSADRLL